MVTLSAFLCIEIQKLYCLGHTRLTARNFQLGFFSLSPAVTSIMCKLCKLLQAKEHHRSCSERLGMTYHTACDPSENKQATIILWHGIHPDNQAIKYLHSPVELAGEIASFPGSPGYRLSPLFYSEESLGTSYQ